MLICISAPARSGRAGYAEDKKKRAAGQETESKPEGEGQAFPVPV